MSVWAAKWKDRCALTSVDVMKQVGRTSHSTDTGRRGQRLKIGQCGSCTTTVCWPDTIYGQSQSHADVFPFLSLRLGSANSPCVRTQTGSGRREQVSASQMWDCSFNPAPRRQEAAYLPVVAVSCGQGSTLASRLANVGSSIFLWELIRRHPASV